VCCEVYGHTLRASAEDLERWKAEGRFDLVLMVGEGGRIWVDPQTGKHLEDCPFLRRTGPEAATCRIHHLKPAICRGYPARVHGYRCVRGIRFPAEEP
jgi:Fe-S-cluster containining protein